MLFINLLELENAINFWRTKSPSQGDSLVLTKEVSALAKPYAILILQGAQRVAVDHLDPPAVDAWNGYLQAVKSDK